jgi:hypothetical protein
MLQREIAIKDSRFARLDPKRRPHYLPGERLEFFPSVQELVGKIEKLGEQ